jgi:hypothetical protein
MVFDVCTARFKGCKSTTRSKSRIWILNQLSDLDCWIGQLDYEFLSVGTKFIRNFDIFGVLVKVDVV